jgi:hypothetical protein
MINMRGQHRASQRPSHAKATRAQAIFRSIPAFVSSAMLAAIIAQIGEIVPSEVDHIVKL